MSDDDDDDVETTMASEGEGPLFDPSKEFAAVFDDLEQLLKNGDVIGALSARAINASLALAAVQGLRAYIAGKKAQAAEDLGMVAEEIRARLAAAGGNNGGPS
jgi:hypothetical protein